MNPPHLVERILTHQLSHVICLGVKPFLKLTKCSHLMMQLLMQAKCCCACSVCACPTSVYTFMWLSRNNKDNRNVKWQWSAQVYRLNGLPDSPQRIAVQCSQGAPQKRCPDPRVNGPIYTCWCWKAAGPVGRGRSQHIAAPVIVRHWAAGLYFAAVGLDAGHRAQCR